MIEERGGEGVDEDEAMLAVVAVVGEDEGGPLPELICARGEGGLDGPEGGEGVDAGEGEGGGGVGG